MKTILHITQCLSGGGAGRELVYLAHYSMDAKEFHHKIVTLCPSTPGGLKLADEYDVSVVEKPSKALLEKEITNADITQVSWWNNPEITDFLHSYIPDTRLIIRYHVAGHTPPQCIVKEHFDMADLNVISYNQLPILHQYDKSWKKERVDWILHGTDLMRMQKTTPKPHQTFNVGYIGTVSFVKMHPDYVKMSNEINIPNIKFDICGNIEEESLLRQVNKLGAQQKFDFKGYVDNIGEIISEMDIFGYPLRPDTYASTDLVLQEVMYAGVPVVVFNYGGLAQTVKNEHNGIIVNTKKEYKEAIEYLYNNPTERERLGKNAKSFVEKNLGIHNTIKKYHSVYERLLKKDKTWHEWGKDSHKPLLEQPLTYQDIIGGLPKRKAADLFIASMGKFGDCFANSMDPKLSNSALFEADETISNVSDIIYRIGIFWYLTYNPKDAYLNFWTGLVLKSRQITMQAIECWAIAHENGFDHWRLYWYMGVALKECGKETEAVKLFEYLARIKPNWEEIIKQNYPSKDIFVSSKIDKLSPEKMYQDIQSSLKGDQSTATINKFEDLLESHPDYALAHNDLGVFFYKQGDKEKAHYHYQQAAQLDPEKITFQKNLADFYYVEMGQVEEAMQIYVKVLNVNPEDIETLLVLAHICVALEKFDDAKDFYNRILKIEPGNKDARQFLDKLGKYQLSVVGGQPDQGKDVTDSNGYFVSAIVSTYNAERFIRGCLEDLENQTIADKLEIVVVNSGSQQNEDEIIREFQKKYSNITYIKTDQRETVYAAWNRGIRAATGKYITNANTDDRHRKDALEVMVDILETLPEISLVYADVIITETENEKFESCSPVGYFNWLNFSREDLLNKGCFMGPQPMWRKDVHDEYGYFDDSFVTSGDYEFWLRISQSFTFMHLPVLLGLYLRSPGSIENSSREKQREENNKIFKMYNYAHSSGKIIRRLKSCLAQDHTEQSSENIKSSEEIYLNILATMGNKQPEDIIEELERLSVSFPEFALVHNDLGVLYHNDGDMEKALNHYQKAVKLESPNATFRKNLADYYLVELDRKEDALQIYLSLLNHHPNDLEMNLTAAHICVAVHNFSKAKVLYKRVLVIDPENEDARKNLRTLDKLKGDLRVDQQSKTESLHKSTSEEYFPAKETIGVNDAPAKDKPQFSIIMPTAAPLKQVRRCVEGIKKHTSESYEILFVNNGTTKGVLKWVRQCIDENHNCRLVKCGKGANPAVCNNTGIKAARGEYVVLLSNDVDVTDGWLSSMLQCFSSIPDAGMVSTMANRARGRQKVAAAVNTAFTEINAFAASYRATNRYRRIVCDILDGYCLLFRRDLTEIIGLFDEQMGALGFEDEDFCLRATLEGCVNKIAGDVYLHRIEHKAPARSKKNFNLKWSGADVQSPAGKRYLAFRAVEKANRAGEEGKIDLAVELFLQAIGLLPEHRESYYKLVEMLVNTKRFQDALDVLNELPEGDVDARQLELAACCKEGLDLLEEAEGCADQALEFNRFGTSALNTKGIIAFRRDDKNTAELYFTRAMETDPGFGEAYSNLGALKWAAGLKDEALSLYERGFILSPTVPDIALNYHCALADLCEYQRAESVLRDAAAVHPRNKKIRYMLIDVLIHQRNHAMAMQEIETAIAEFGVDDGILSSALKIREKICPLTISRKTGSDSTVSLCMIVKDEEEHLARCLQRVRPVVDEIIVVDTGSKDRSRDIARVFGAKVFDFEWAEDFAEARNYSLSKANGKMIFVMDADEVISPLDYELFRQTAGQSSRQRSAFIINTRNYTMDNNLVEWVANEGYYDMEEAGTGWTPSAKIRLFPNEPHIRFDFPVHEMVEPSLQKLGIAMKLCKFQIHHYGKLNRDKSEKKGEAYYEIGCKKLEEMGDAPVALRELAIQAEGLKKHEEAVELWQRFIAIVPNEPKAYINMGISYCNLGQFDKVLATAEEALKLAPDIKEGHFNCGLAKLHLGHPDQAIEILEMLCDEMPEYLPARFILAAAWCCREDKKRGVALLKELSGTAIGPGLAIRCHELASRFVLLQRPAYALALLDAAIDSQNANKDVLDLYADCLKRTDFHKKTGTYE